MVLPRVDTVGAELPNGTFWIMGSYSGAQEYTTELYNEGFFTAGPDLPDYGHVGIPCATQVTDDITFFGNDFG